MLTAPSTFIFSDDENKVPFSLVKDKFENYPSFERQLYCHLDYDIVILMICYINLIE